MQSTSSMRGAGRPRAKGLKPRLKKTKSTYYWYVTGRLPGEDARIDRSLGIVEPDPGRQTRRQEAVEKIREIVEQLTSIAPEVGPIQVADQDLVIDRPPRMTVAWVLDTYVRHAPHVSAEGHRTARLKKHLGDVEIGALMRETGGWYYHQRQRDEHRPRGAGDGSIVRGASLETIKREIRTYYIALRWVSEDHRFAWALTDCGYSYDDLTADSRRKMKAPRASDVQHIELARASQRVDRPDAERPMTTADFWEIFRAGARHLQVYLMLATLCGPRKGAILGLKWDRVSLSPSNAWVDFNDPETPRSNKRKPAATLPNDVRGTLLAWHQEQMAEARARKVPPPQFVITWKCHRVKDIDNAFRKAMQRADETRVAEGRSPRFQIGKTEKGWPRYRYSLHMLKSFFVTAMIRSGMPPETVAFLTDTNPKTLKRWYIRELGAFEDFRAKAFASESGERPADDRIRLPEHGFLQGASAREEA